MNTDRHGFTERNHEIHEKHERGEVFQSILIFDWEGQRRGRKGTSRKGRKECKEGHEWASRARHDMDALMLETASRNVVQELGRNVRPR